MTRCVSIHGFLLASALCSIGSLAAAQTYQLIDLGSLGGNRSTAAAINESGEVTGSSYEDPLGVTTRAFLYSDGVMRSLGTLGGDSWGYGINAAGQVVGTSFAGQPLGWSVTLFSGGTVQSLGTLGGDFSSTGYGINDRGQITGSSAISREGGAHAFLYDAGMLRDLGTLGGPNSVGSAITADGRVVGNSNTGDGQTRAFLYSNGTMTNLGSLGGSVSEATAINEQGQIVGWSYTGNNVHAFLYDHGSMQDIDPSSGGTYSWAWGINESGDIVGSATRGLDTFAFLYRNGRLLDLNGLLDPLGSKGWDVFDARGINDSGQIAATALFGESMHAVLLTPAVPEPATWATMLLGVGLLVGGLRGQHSRRSMPQFTPVP